MAEEVGEKVMPKTVVKIVAKKITFARVIGSVGRTGLLAVADGGLELPRCSLLYLCLRYMIVLFQAIDARRRKDEEGGNDRSNSCN